MQCSHLAEFGRIAYGQEEVVERLRLEKFRADHALVELEDVDRQLQMLATTDLLTGAASHRQFADRADEAALAPLALLARDPDRFKEINNRHGTKLNPNGAEKKSPWPIALYGD